MELQKYRGIIPAFYACYDAHGEISPQGVRALAGYLADQGVRGLYVGGSSGECIYQSVAERKLVLEHVMEAVAGRDVTVIAHVACNNTKDSQELAAHAQSLGVDAIAAIPPIYFRLPDRGIAKYWNDISAAAPDTDFIIYNIPQLAGVALSIPLLKEMLKNPRVVGVKNSSMPVQDIQMWKDEGGEDFVVFNGPDEQFLAGLSMGAVGGIGGTYAAMPQLFLKVWDLYHAGEMARAAQIQNEICRVIYQMCSGAGNLYAMIKAILRELAGLELGGVRAPLLDLGPDDGPIVTACAEHIRAAIAQYC